MITINQICPTTTRQRVKDGDLLVDVREVDEVNELAFDVPAIINIPLSEFEERFRELPMDRNLVIVCRSGARSLRVAGFLLNNGYTQVVNMEHGLLRWVKKGFPVIGDRSAYENPDTNQDCCSPTSGAGKSSGCC